jgi:hypothetical protein
MQWIDDGSGQRDADARSHHGADGDDEAEAFIVATDYAPVLPATDDNR